MFPPSQVVPQIIVAHTAWSNLIPSMSWKVTFKMPGNCQRSLYYQTQQFLNNENFKKLPFWLFDLPKDSKSDSTIYFFCCVCVCMCVQQGPASPAQLSTVFSHSFPCEKHMWCHEVRRIWCIFVGKSKPKKNQTFTWVVLKKCLNQWLVTNIGV